jgi:hypothetical protein
MGAFWKIKNQKWSRAILSVIVGLTDRVPKLKNFKTLGGPIEKIKILGVELKIAANFEGINNNFSLVKLHKE